MSIRFPDIVLGRKIGMSEARELGFDTDLAGKSLQSDRTIKGECSNIRE